MAGVIDSSVTGPPDAVPAGKLIETVQVTTADGFVKQREVVSVADPADPLARAAVLAGIPVGGVYGSVVRIAGMDELIELQRAQLALLRAMQLQLTSVVGESLGDPVNLIEQIQ